MITFYNFEPVADLLLDQKVGVIPTDTTYGLVGLALSSSVAERIYAIKGRPPAKPFIILIGNLAGMAKLGLAITPDQAELIKSVWPGPVSLIFPSQADDFYYLHRGSDSLAIRLPADDRLQELLSQTGPLIATSANRSGEPTATTLAEAITSFGDSVDFYVDGGTVTATPSRLVDLRTDPPHVLRP